MTKILTPKQEEQKRHMYEHMGRRRRKFIERIGYDAWDPFAEPNDPIDIRMGPARMTAQQLVSEFMKSKRTMDVGVAYKEGIEAMALGVTKHDEKIKAMYEFSLWYNAMLTKQGRDFDGELT
ncbi:hypothetical protein [Desulfoplanes sp.]